MSEELNEAGYHVSSHLCNSISYAVPQQRPRIYIILVRLSDTPIDQYDDDYNEPSWIGHIGDRLRWLKVLEEDMLPLQSFILLDDDQFVLSLGRRKEAVAVVREAREQLQNVPNIHEAPIAQSDVCHQRLYTLAGLEYTPNYSTHPEFYERIQHLPGRQKEVAWYLEFVAAPTLGGMECIADISLNLAWLIANVKVGVCTCVVSTCLPWAIIRKRLLCGAELLQLQGIPICRQKVSCDFSDSQLTDFVGNTFNAFVLLPVMTAVLIAIGPHWHTLDRAPVATLAVQEPVAAEVVVETVVAVASQPPVAPPASAPTQDAAAEESDVASSKLSDSD